MDLPFQLTYCNLFIVPAGNRSAQITIVHVITADLNALTCATVQTAPTWQSHI